MRRCLLAFVVACHAPKPVPATSVVASAAPTATALDLHLPPGVVIDHSPASSRQYIGSPSIAVLPDGSYVASHDLFGPGSTKDHTLVFASTNRGANWTRISELEGQWWSTLFEHRGELYILGTSRQFGAIVIRRSTDSGRTWSEPITITGDEGYHCAPVPIVEYRGRLVRAFEHRGHQHFGPFVISAAVDADLLDKWSWKFTSSPPAGEDWLDGGFENWLEGNAVVAPDGTLYDMLRVNSRGDDEKAALVRIDAPIPRFDGFVDFPGGSKKFTVRFDAPSKLYWSLVNTIPKGHTGNHTDKIRNTLTLVSSPDLRTWTERATVLHHDDPVRHAFQYVDWLVDGDDLIAVSRTAYDDDEGGAHTAHDANYFTFHRIERFRTR